MNRIGTIEIGGGRQGRTDKDSIVGVFSSAAQHIGRSRISFTRRVHTHPRTALSLQAEPNVGVLAYNKQYASRI